MGKGLQRLTQLAQLKGIIDANEEKKGKLRSEAIDADHIYSELGKVSTTDEEYYTKAQDLMSRRAEYGDDNAAWLQAVKRDETWANVKLDRENDFKNRAWVKRNPDLAKNMGVTPENVDSLDSKELNKRITGIDTAIVENQLRNQFSTENQLTEATAKAMNGAYLPELQKEFKDTWNIDPNDIENMSEEQKQGFVLMASAHEKSYQDAVGTLAKTDQAIQAAFSSDSNTSVEQLKALGDNLQLQLQALVDAPERPGIFEDSRQIKMNQIKAAIANLNTKVNNAGIRNTAKIAGTNSHAAEVLILQSTPELRAESADRRSNLQKDLIEYNRMGDTEEGQAIFEELGITNSALGNDLSQLDPMRPATLQGLDGFIENKAAIKEIQKGLKSWEALQGTYTEQDLIQGFKELIPGLDEAQFVKDFIESARPGLLEKGALKQNTVNKANSLLMDNLIGHVTDNWEAITKAEDVIPHNLFRAASMLEALGGDNPTFKQANLIEKLRSQGLAERNHQEAVSDEEMSVLTDDVFDLYVGYGSGRAQFTYEDGTEASPEAVLKETGRRLWEQNTAIWNHTWGEETAALARDQSIHDPDALNDRIQFRSALGGKHIGPDLSTEAHEFMASVFNVAANHDGLAKPWEDGDARNDTASFRLGVKNMLGELGLTDENAISIATAKIVRDLGDPNRDFGTNLKDVFRLAIREIPHDVLTKKFQPYFRGQGGTFTASMKSELINYGEGFIESAIDESSVKLAEKRRMVAGTQGFKRWEDPGMGGGVVEFNRPEDKVSYEAIMLLGQGGRGYGEEVITKRIVSSEPASQRQTSGSGSWVYGLNEF